MAKKYYITTPLYYVNASPHIGHAYTQVACDTMTRFLKQRRQEVFFMTGTDEHGEKIERAAQNDGFSSGEEKKFVDKIIPKFTSLWEKLNIEYDYFLRTTWDGHEETVRKILINLREKGDIYKGVYQGWFCTPCEMFWSHTQAPDGICPDCKRRLEKLDEENYFFKMSKYQDRLIKCIESGEMTIRPQMRKNEVLSFLKGNQLQDLCISRSKKRLRWGIELPFDTDFVAYVWVDALVNYVSGVGYLRNDEQFRALWPADMHVIGKDIIKHHAVYWPILLFALGVSPPKRIFAHGWWVMSGEKMSKSKGNVVDPVYLIDEKGYPVDSLRYFLLSQVKFGWDGSFSEELLVEKYNSDLANDLGNLLNRTITMVEKYFEGITPERKRSEGDISPGTDLVSAASSLQGKVAECMDLEKQGPEFQEALQAIWDVVHKANKYIEVSAPWKHAKAGDQDMLSIIMDNLIQSLGLIALMIYPFMPYTAQGMWEQIGMKKTVDIKKVSYKDIKWGIIARGTKTCKGSPLFPRLTK